MGKPLPRECTKAEFSRLLEVDAAMVSRWVAAERLVMTASGRVSVQPSLRRLQLTTDPARGGRSGSAGIAGSGTVATVERLLAQAAEAGPEATARIAELERELAIEREFGERREQAAEWRAAEKADQALIRHNAALMERWEEACAARQAGRLGRWLEELICVEFYQHDLEEFRNDFPECEEPADALAAGSGSEAGATAAEPTEAATMAAMLATAPPLPALDAIEDPEARPAGG